MKKNLTVFFVFITMITSILTGQNIFPTVAGNITFPGELVYSAYEHDINGMNIWAQGYSAIEGDSVYYTTVLYTADKSTAYYCTQHAACLKDVFMLDDSVKTLDDPTFTSNVYIFLLVGKAQNNRRIKSVYSREYSRDNLQVVKRYEEYSILFSYNDKKKVDYFYQRLLALVGKTEQKE